VVVCHCLVLNHRQIQDAVKSGAHTVDDVTEIFAAGGLFGGRSIRSTQELCALSAAQAAFYCRDADRKNGVDLSTSVQDRKVTAEP
jgi:bacterioferritin-associated ferredoxin